MSEFETFMKETMLPAECDDERVLVGMRICWDAATTNKDRQLANCLKIIDDYKILIEELNSALALGRKEKENQKIASLYTLNR